MGRRRIATCTNYATDAVPGTGSGKEQPTNGEQNFTDARR